MKRPVVTLLTVGLAGFAALVGCAQGTDSSSTIDVLPTEPDDIGKKEDDQSSAKVPNKPKPPPLEDEDKDNTSSSGGSTSSSGGSTSSSGGSTSSSGGSTSSSGGSTSSSGGSTSSSGGSGAACVGATKCTTGAGAYDAGYISGDTGADVIELNGYKTQWIKVWLGEDSVWGDPLTMRVTLTSPPGANYDLFVHTETCATPTVQSTATTPTDQVRISLPDVLLGAPDDQWVLIEVRHVSGECDANVRWTLKLEGNK